MNIISKLIASRFEQLIDELFNPNVCSFDTLFNFKQNLSANDDNRSILYEKLAQLLTLTGELFKTEPRLPMILLTEKIKIRHLLTNYEFPTNSSQTLVDVLFTSILPIMNPITAANFIETLCSWKQATFFLQSKDGVVSNDYYNRISIGAILFRSFNMLIGQFTAETSERPMKILEGYAMLLQSVFKNIEYRTKAETDWLSDELNRVFAALFLCWENFIVSSQSKNRKVSQETCPQINKKFTKLVKLLYAIVQDSTLLALQRCFFDEDYSQLLGQYDEQVEMIFKQTFSSNFKFANFIASKRLAFQNENPSEDNDIEEGVSIREPMNKSLSTLVHPMSRDRKIRLPEFFCQSYGSDSNHAKITGQLKVLKQEIQQLFDNFKAKEGDNKPLRYTSQRLSLY